MCAAAMEGKLVYLEKVTVGVDRFRLPAPSPPRFARSKHSKVQNEAAVLILNSCFNRKCLQGLLVLLDSIMEAAITTLVSQFKVFAGHDASSNTLSKDEFHKLVASQLPNFVKVCLFLIDILSS